MYFGVNELHKLPNGSPVRVLNEEKNERSRPY